MSNETRNGYQFTIDSATNTVTAVAEVNKNGEFRLEAIDSQETWTFDPATSTVTRTDGESGNLEITTFTDVDGDGIFVHASTDLVLPPIVICPAPIPTPDAVDPIMTITTKPVQPVKPVASQNGYQFTIDSTTNAITAVYEVKRGVAKLEKIDASKTFTYDAASSTVTKTEVDHGLTETVIYSDPDGDGLFAKASKSYASANGSTKLKWDARHVGGDSDDHFKGGSGHDYYAGGLGNDQLNGGGGDDDLYGGEGNDQLAGGAGADSIIGGTGTDKLDGGVGNDSLNGGAGGDVVFGGLGKDVLLGGAGNDVFKYSNIGDSGISATTRDVIADFTAGDKIDLSAIDAKAGFTANDAFAFIGGAANLTLAKANGAVWFDKGVVYASTDRDLAAEFQIELTGVTHVTAADFVL